MSKTLQPTVHQVLAAHRVVNECRELGDDAATWTLHLFRELSQLVGSELVMGGELAGCTQGSIRGLGHVAWGFENGFNVAGWEESVRRLSENPRQNVLIQKFFRAYQPEAGSCMERADLIRDHQWFRSDEYDAVFRVVGIERCLHSALPVAPDRDEHSCFIFNRAPGRPPFSEREKALVLFIHRMIAPLVGGTLARFTDPSPTELAPRPRQVLKLLLEGEADKQIALKLGRSPYTVNQYVKLIFKHFGVNSRAELLARWLRRGWNNRAVWAMPDAV